MNRTWSRRFMTIGLVGSLAIVAIVWFATSVYPG